jgi:3'-phosphoadenosine 5'-phosphosulfate sulfotransferase (PAPS reductase)/FAD synthetase
MHHVVSYSGGAGSWGAARRVLAEVGAENMTLLFADTNMEDEDLYRFVKETVEDLGCELVTLNNGQTPWDVFRQERFLGNTRVDPCSKILKREALRRWVEDHYRPEEVTVHLGIDWTEEHRLTRAAERWKPYTLRAPLCEEPLIDKVDLLAELRELGIEPPRLYALD